MGAHLATFCWLALSLLRADGGLPPDAGSSRPQLSSEDAEVADQLELLENLDPLQELELLQELSLER